MRAPEIPQTEERQPSESRAISIPDVIRTIIDIVIPPSKEPDRPNGISIGLLSPVERQILLALGVIYAYAKLKHRTNRADRGEQGNERRR